MYTLLQESIRFYEYWLERSSLGAEFLRPLIAELRKLEAMVEIRPSIPPVVETWLDPALKMETIPACEPLIRNLVMKGRNLKWVPSPPDYISPAFNKGFAYTQLVGHAHRKVESAFFKSDKVALGFSLQAPGLFYPPHYHKAVEFYTPLTGTAVWQHGTKAPEPQPPGVFIFHESDLPHALQTEEEPLLTIWAWIGDLMFPTSISKREWL